MRSLLITTHTYYPERSGVAGVAEAIATGLARMGWSVSIATGKPPGASAHEVIDSVNIYRFSVFGDAFQGVTGEVSRFAAFLHENPFDRYLLNGALSWTTDLILECKAVRDRDTVLISHGFSRDGQKAYDQYFRHLFEKCKELRKVVCLSEVLSDYQSYRQAGLRNLAIISNGVHREFWEYQGGGPVTCEVPYVINISNHNPLKGHALFADIAEHVQNDVKRWRFRQMGTSYPANKWNAGRYGVKGGCWYACNFRAIWGKVQLMDGSSRESVRENLCGSTLKLLTSAWEAAPLSLIEAMAAGVPWVSTEVGCVRQWPGGVACEGKHALLEATKRLLREPRLREDLGEAGRRAVSTIFDWEIISNNFI